MDFVTSADGTRIGFVKTGSGAPLVLVTGALNDHTSRSSGLGLAKFLEAHFTVFSYDRRGRGQSPETQPYGIEHEIEDLVAVIAHAVASEAVTLPLGDTHGAMVYGMSSGAQLALLAASAGAPIIKLAMYEPPYFVDGTRSIAPDYAERLRAFVDAGQPGEAVALFMTEAVQMPAQVVDTMKKAPFWPHLAAFGPSLLHDAEIMGDGGLPDEEALARVTIPVTVIDGGASPEWMRAGSAAAAKAVPKGTYRTLPEQTHDVDPELLARVLVEVLDPNK